MHDSAMITLAAASRRINRSTETVAKWMAAGDGPQILTFGRRRYVLEKSFEHWWDSRTRPTISQPNGDDSRSAAAA
jgi:hypothetical protein